MPKGRPWEYDPPFDLQGITDAAAGMEFGTDAAGGRAISRIQATRGVPAVAAGAALAAGASALPATGAAAPAAGKVLEFLSRFRRAPGGAPPAPPGGMAQAAAGAAPVAVPAAAKAATAAAPEAQRIVDMLMRMKFENKFSDGQIIDALKQEGYSASVTRAMLKALGGQ